MAGRRGDGYPSYGPPAGADEAPGSAPESAIAVHTLTSAAKDLIEGAFPALWVRGEVSDFKAHRNGHWYFALRDADAQVKCVIWSSAAKRIPAPPDDGMQVLAYGQMTVWPVRGDLQFSVRALEAAGDGLWRKALERTRLSLEKDGLLDPARKRALPAFPRRIAVITSPDGAAMHDIITVARSRSADVELVIVPAKVQGEGAPESLVAAIERVGRWHDADLLIIGRGGGAREDLWAFNDERVARALAGCPIPTVSAVGHEVDVTICDLVADVRAATPSAAAEIAVPSRREVVARVASLGTRLAGAARRREERAVAALSQVQRRLGLAATRVVERRRSRIEAVAGQLHALSPLQTLARGFAVARTLEGATLSGRDQFVPGAPFDLWLRDGIVSAVAGAARPLPEVTPVSPAEEGV
ncbi:MAG: exodeoxyribonuclease VII large subunit [Gemmatimonadota bacterium]|nr:exodeoxyribonuclease VII large subunit [Gemmatimonadota bacterium]MDQ8167633.1 exodeoxyribonuclease VII large subunit [Gemmatimonadota bacterium]MDQ8172510.1 exodeoxyribonuclease VII large subunit [Gemmatimonadota bacterium]